MIVCISLELAFEEMSSFCLNIVTRIAHSSRPHKLSKRKEIPHPSFHWHVIFPNIGKTPCGHTLPFIWKGSAAAA